MEFNGSICAEHGVGILKKADLLNYKSNLEINLMRSIKASIDPMNIMNPNKVI
jgi:FAD/FMN-containing dehydrogenase